MERANRIGAQAAVIIGEAEIADGQVIVRDLAEGTQERVPRTGMLRALAATAGGLAAMEAVVEAMVEEEFRDDLGPER
jgi:histidyl-tRNA synthetase